jgi:hypothetical protein
VRGDDIRQMCHECDKAIVLSANRSTIVEYQQMPGFWYIRHVCGSCGAVNKLIPMTRIAEALALNCQRLVLPDYPTPEDVAWCEEKTGLHFVVSDHPISTHDEREIAFLEHLLNTQAEELLDYPEAA